MRQVAIWDLPTRAFHWLLAVAVASSYATGGEEGRWFTVHVASGYTVAALLVFRLVWGFIGSRHSRFADFVYSWRAVRDYAGALLQRRHRHFVGHNPLGGWMVITMIVVLAGSVATGLVSGEPEEAAGPLLGVLVAASSGEAIADVHEVLGNLVLALALIHIAAVFLDWALTGENLIPAMVHGDKTLDEDLAAQEPPTAARGRGLALAVAVGALLAVAIQQTDFASLAGDGDAVDHEDGGSSPGDEESGEEDYDERHD
jgi:cytochrome b